MTKAEMAAEPTMDEILASIRKIIAEEPIGSRPLPKSLPKGSSEKSPVSSEPSRWPELPAAGAPMFGDRGARQVPAAAMPAQATPAAPTTTAPLPLPARNEVAAGLPAADRVADPLAGPLAGPLADRVVDPLADALSRSAAVPSATPPLPEPTLPVPPRAGEARLTEAPSSRAPAMAAPPAVPTAAAVPPEFDRLAAALRGSASVAAMPGAAFATPPPPPPPAPPAPPAAAVMPTGGASSPSAGTGAARAVPAPAPFADDLDDLLDDSEVADHAQSPLAGSPADAPEHVALPPIAPPRTEIAPQAAEVAPSGRVIARRSLDFGAIVPGREAEAPVPAPVTAPVPAPASGSAPASAPPPPDTPLPPVARAAPPSAGAAVTAPAPSAAPAASVGAATPQVAAAPALAKQEASKPTSQARAFDKMLSARIAMAVKPASRPAEAAAPVAGPVVLAAMPAKQDDTGTPATADVVPARAAATDASALDGDEAAQSAFGALAAGLAASTDPSHPSEATSPDEEPTLIVDPAAAIAAASTAATPSNAPVARDPSAMLRATASVQRAAEPSPAGPAAAAPPPPAAAAVPSASAGGALALGGVQMPAAGSPVGVRTVEDIVAELLRPMLREWLAENMPRIVEKALRIELAEGLKTVQHTPLKGPDAKG